jgi:putative ABC transport system ATP-binding protein
MGGLEILAANDIIVIDNISKVYVIGQERVVALRNVSLGVREGEFCCVLGTSGSGKSTLLNMIAGLEKPTRGDIIIKGQHINKMSENRLARFRQDHIGFIFQSYNLMPTLTARENVAMPLIFRGFPKRERDRLAIKMLNSVGLGSHAKHKPTQMSGGQQQRVGIARAFVGRPEIVFADEPTGNLDSRTREEVMRLMINISRSNGHTLIMVTHDNELSQYADRIVKIKDGEIDDIVVNTRQMDHF